jgi:hypothetical protein
MRKFLAGAAALLFAASCTHNTPLPEPTPTPSAGTCDPDTVYFANDVLPLFTANCASSGCHDDNWPADGLALTSYSGIMDEVKAGDPYDSEVFTVLTASGGDLMPPAPASPLDSTAQWTIKTWIEQGALNNSCSDCDSTNITFSQGISPIMSAQCVSCHSSSNASGGVVLSAHGDVVDAVNNSNLVACIERTAKPMPPAASLSDCEVYRINQWIANGMPNN